MGANRVFQFLYLCWKSQESGERQYKSRPENSGLIPLSGKQGGERGRRGDCSRLGCHERRGTYYYQLKQQVDDFVGELTF